MYGNDVYYIPRTLNNYDPVYGSDDSSSYENAFPVEMYIKSIDGFQGDGTFYSQIGGLEIRDRIIFTVARRTFQSEVADYSNQVRPNEGDLIFFPMNNRIFQIKYVNKYEIFYQVGTLLTWELTCELFEYSGETFDTGIDAIDTIVTNMNTNVLNWGFLDENGAYITDEFDDYIILEGSPVNSSETDAFPVDESQAIQNESDTFVDFTQEDPFSEGNI